MHNAQVCYFKKKKKERKKKAQEKNESKEEKKNDKKKAQEIPVSSHGFHWITLGQSDSSTGALSIHWMPEPEPLPRQVHQMSVG